MRLYFALNISLNTTHIKWRQVIAIRHRFQAIFITANARKFLDMRIPWCDISITNGPVDRVPVPLGCRKLKIAPALASPAPHNGFAANLVSPYPIKRLFLDVRMFGVFDKKMVGILAIGITATDHRVFFSHCQCLLLVVLKFPWALCCCRVIFDMFDIAPALQYECLYTQVA